MPEEPNQEPKKEEPTPAGNPGAPAENNGAATPEDLAVIKAELEEERKAIAAAQALIQEKDATIADLQAKLTGATHATEAAAAELTTVKEAQAKAVAKYLEASRALNPTIPADVIAGATIDDIDASVAKARSIAESVKKSLEAQAKEAKVPAGAPARTEIPLEGLSPREKIAAGIKQKGGT